MNFGTLGHYAVNSANGAHDAVIAWLVEKDPDGMSVAEIDAQLDRLQQLSVEVSKAHTKSDVGLNAYNEAASKNAKKLRAAENAQTKINAESPGEKRTAMEKELADYLAQLESDQAELDSLKKTSDSATQFYTYLQGLYNDKETRLKSMKSQLSVAKNTMQTAKLREGQAEEQAQVAKRVAGGSGSSDKFEVAINAMKKSTTAANERAEAAERLVKGLTEAPHTGGSFMAQAEAEVSHETAAPTDTSDRIAALKAHAA